MGMLLNSSKTSGFCRAGEDIYKKIPDERQRITLWWPFTHEKSFKFKPAVIARLVERDLDGCLKTEVLEDPDKDKKGNPFTHKIQRNTFQNYVHYRKAEFFLINLKS